MKLKFQNTLYKKMVLYITMLVILIILTLSFVLYFNFERIQLDMQFNSNLSILSEISYSANYMHDVARNLAAYLYSNTDYVPLQTSKAEYIEDAYKQMQSIEALVTHSSNVQSVYIYNGSIQRFYSTWWHFFSSTDDFIDQDIVDLIQNNKLPHKRSFTPILRKIPVYEAKGPNQQYMNVLTYIIYDYFGNDQKIQNAIIVNLSSDYLAGLIDLLNTKSTLKGSDTFILNEKGQVVAHSKASAVFSDWTNRSYVKKVLDAKEKNGYFIDKLDGKKVVVTYVSSDILDWKFVNITPYKEIFKDINKMKNNIYLLCIGLIIFGFSLSYFLARYLYSPIRSMMGRVEQLSNTKIDKKAINEMDFVTGVLTDTLEKAHSMQTIKLENDILKKQKFLKELLFNEDLDQENLANTIEQKKFKRKNVLVDKVISIIESEYMDKSLCQEVVAHKLNISRDYLGKIFREAYSKSFADYLTEVRLQKAAQLLKDGKKNLTEILEDIGWENKNYFYTSFKQKYGTTTSEYKTRSLN